MQTVARKSIIRKVSKRVIVALLITVFALSIANLIYMTNRVYDEMQTELTLVTDLTAAKIDTWTQQLEGITKDIADTVSGLQVEDQLSINRIINRYAASHDELFFVYLATEEGDMYMARGVQFAEGVDARQRGWYVKAKAAGHTIVTDPYMSATRKEIMLATAATPIFFGTSMMGVVGIDADIAYINEMVGSIDFKDGAYGFLIDTEGNIIAHKNQDFLPTPDKKTNVTEAIPELAEAIKKPTTELIRGTDFEGTDVLYSITRIPDSRWTLGVAYPRTILLGTLDKGIRISLFTALICMVIAVLYVRKTIKGILKPIERINPVLDKVLEGNFSTNVDITKEEDELGLLQQKLAHIIERLSELIEKQKFTLGEMEKGNLIVEDLEPLPGDLNEISTSVNSIKETFNDMISDIQFSAINLQSFAMGANETDDLEEMKMIFEELAAESNALMDKTSKFITMPTFPKDEDFDADYSEDE